jgi:hypothetical protein
MNPKSIALAKICLGHNKAPVLVVRLGQQLRFGPFTIPIIEVASQLHLEGVRGPHAKAKASTADRHGSHVGALRRGWQIQSGMLAEMELVSWART